MFNYPKININLSTIFTNTKSMLESCSKYGITPVGVTKLVCSNLDVVNTLIDAGIKTISDSRLKNLERISNLNIDKMLLRIPALSEVEEVIKYSDISLNSELETLKSLSQEAVKQQKEHKVIIMHDLGDLREGSFDEEETLSLAKHVINLPNLILEGIGSNLACYGGVESTTDNQNKLVYLARKIEDKFNIKLNTISGASSVALFLMLDGGIPEGINQLRLGASLLMGIGLNDDPIPGTKQDAFTLETEIIELKEKPSVPKESTALDAFGLKPEFIDRGIRKRAICSIGKQDVDFEQLFPIDKDVLLIGSSSDHLIIDVTESINEYKIGDIVSFNLSYSGVLELMTSEFVIKNPLK